MEPERIWKLPPGSLLTREERAAVRKGISILRWEWERYDNEEVTCYRCGGKGKYDESYIDNPHGYGFLSRVTVHCPKCDVCKGTGRIKRKQDKRLFK